jgi:hypothetical protein
MRFAAVLALLGGCGSHSPARPDAVAGDASLDGRSADAPADTCTTCPPPAYQDVTDPGHWASFDLTAVTEASSGYTGGTYDGRYVYFAPSSSTVVRYDTHATFAGAASWESFDASAIDTAAHRFQGAVFDGRYVYYVPDSTGHLLRYDTHGGFTSASSYQAFDIGSLDATVHGFEGATFDGRYIYFSPWYAQGSYQSIAFRYDTTATLTSPTAWSSYDLTNVDIEAEGYFGAVYDGRYVSFVPLRHTGNQKSGLVVRFDTQGGAFTSAPSWSVYNTQTLDPTVAGFAGAAFDGTHLYFVPLQGMAARYDTTQGFTAPASWQAFSTASVGAAVASLQLGGFDGQYVYLGANSRTTIARVDTTASFSDAASWSTFDVATLTPAADRTSGMVYDGRYMYFPPAGLNEVVARFDTKTSALMPALPQFHGSFF